MALNKDICRRCFRDNVKWESGTVDCVPFPTKPFFRRVNVNGQPPEWCRFAAEHVVSQEQPCR